MLIVSWTDEALADLEEIVAYIADRNIVAALGLQEMMQETAEKLPAHPYMYRPGRVPGTREAIVHPNYVLVYAVREVIEIIAVVHARQEYP